MVDDALKVTRNLQRLLLLASVVAIVFLASLRDVRQEQALLDDLAQLPRVLDDAAYARWLEARYASPLSGIDEPVERFIDNLARNLPEGVDLSGLSTALAPPAHVARGTLPRLDLNEQSFGDLERSFVELATNRNAVMLFADTDGILLMARLSEAIAEANPTGQTEIRNAQLHLRTPPPDDQPHLYLDTARELMPLELYFEIYTPGRAAPTHTVAVEARRVMIPNSSVQSWWESQRNVNPLFLAIRARSVVPPLNLSDSLAELHDDLEDHVLTAQAANRTIELVGISIPGSLGLFGIPAILLGFSVSLLIHLRHLQRLAAEHWQTFRQFSWTPLSPGDLWLWETTGLLLLLPVAVHLLLIYRAPAFGDPLLLPIIAGFGGAVGTALAGVALLRSIGGLRRRLYLR